MTIGELRERVWAEFGPRLERATPAHMLEFLCRLEVEIGGGSPHDRPLILSGDGAKDYEQIVNEFLAQILDAPGDQAAVLLWLFAAQMHYSRLAEQVAQLSDLFSFDVSEG